MKTVINQSNADVWFDNFIAVVFYVWLVAVLMLALAAFTGCQSAAMRAAIEDAQNKKAALNAKTTVDVTEIEDGADVDVANVKADASVNDAKAEASPTAHPVTATNQLVKRLRECATTVTIIFSLLFAASVGLSRTCLSGVGKFGMCICGWIAALSFTAALALPFLLWVGGAAIVGLICFVVYEVIHYKSVSKAAAAIEADLGISHSSSLTLSSTADAIEAKVTSAIKTVESETGITSTTAKAGTPAAPIAVTGATAGTPVPAHA
jgi:hypothetical protein